jgi:hypothetical protein
MYQPLIPWTMWLQTWQWYSQRPGLSSVKRAVVTSPGPSVTLSIVGPPNGGVQRCPWMWKVWK